MSTHMNTPPLHQPFTWLNEHTKHDQNAQFAETVISVSQGARTIAGILRSNLDDLAFIADGNETQPLLSAYEIGTLAGLLLVSLEKLTYDAEHRLKAIAAAASKRGTV